jgi:hypothetical protein
MSSSFRWFIQIWTQYYNAQHLKQIWHFTIARDRSSKCGCPHGTYGLHQFNLLFVNLAHQSILSGGHSSTPPPTPIENSKPHLHGLYPLPNAKTYPHGSFTRPPKTMVCGKWYCATILLCYACFVCSWMPMKNNNNKIDNCVCLDIED